MNKTEESEAFFSDCKGLQSLFVTHNWYKINSIAVAVICLLLAPFTSILNLLALIVVTKTKRLQSPSNMLLGNLCITDMLTGFLTEPLVAANYLLGSRGQTICLLYIIPLYIGLCLGTMSYLIIFTIWTDRYFAIFQPFSYRKLATKNLLLKLIVCIWIICVTVHLAAMFTVGYSVYVVFVMAFLPLTLIWCIYVQFRIVFLVRRISREVAAQPSSNQRNSEDQAISNAIKVCVPVFLTMIICYIPYGFLRAWVIISDKIDSQELRVAYAWTMVLILVNSLLNFMIYYYRITDFTNELKRLIQNFGGNTMSAVHSGTE